MHRYARAPPRPSSWTPRLCLALLLLAACVDVSKCSLPLATRSSRRPSPRAARGAVAQLLGGEEALFAMLEEADGGSSGPRYAPHAGRAPAARQRWMQVYRNVLRDEDIDTLLTANVSVRALGEPLLLGRDVDLLALVPRGTDKKPEKGKYSSTGGAETRRMASLFPKAGAPAGASGNDHAYVNGFPVNPALRAVDLTRLHQAFTDGFELVVHDMHMRSLATHDLVSFPHVLRHPNQTSAQKTQSFFSSTANWMSAFSTTHTPRQCQSTWPHPPLVTAF
jgi:hypothetical protein